MTPVTVLTPAALGLLAFCIVFETLQQLSFKAGVNRAEKAPHLARGLALQPLIWAGVAIWLVEVIAWILVLGRAPLSIAYPLMTLSYAAIPLAGVFLLKERLTSRQILGAVVVAGGALCVGLSGL